MSSRAIARINLAALQHNLQRVRHYAPQSKVMAAIKSDAYGHGAHHAALALADADALAVATFEEAMQLRWAGEQRSIVLLGGVLDAEEARGAAEHGFEVVVHDPAELDILAGLTPPFTLKVWIKLDSGMHRLGFDPALAGEVHERILSQPQLECLGWMTHLACADDLDDDYTRHQLSVFDDGIGDRPGIRSIANSAGIVAWPDSHADWVRPGIMLYGSCPILEKWPEDYGLQAVMTLQSTLISVHEIKAGEGIGYGQTWTCPEDMPVGVVGIGYGDGYPRHAPNGTPVWVNGITVPMVGRVSMDMICVDLRNCPDARVGHTVELWGVNVQVDRVARMAGTISYELFCRLTNRVEFVYE